MTFPRMIAKTRPIHAFFATIAGETSAMKILGFISLLALIAIGGAVYSDLLLTSEQVVTQHTN